MRLKYNVDTKVIFNIGDPLEHSCASFLNNSMYEFANLNAINIPIVVKKGALKDFVAAAKTLHASGFDVTTPHKADIIEYLDTCDEASRKYECVNCVRIENGRLEGKGIDGKGFADSTESVYGKLHGMNALVIGAGSVSGMIVDELIQRGADRIVIANRTLSKADRIASVAMEYRGKKCLTVSLEDAKLNDFARDASIIVQCTTLGNENSGKFPSLGFLEFARKECIVADLLYPEPQFYREASRLGLRAINGQQMMLMQQPEKIRFYFSAELEYGWLKEANESLEIAVAMRKARYASRKL